MSRRSRKNFGSSNRELTHLAVARRIHAEHGVKFVKDRFYHLEDGLWTPWHPILISQEALKIITAEGGFDVRCSDLTLIHRMLRALAFARPEELPTPPLPDMRGIVGGASELERLRGLDPDERLRAARARGFLVCHPKEDTGNQGAFWEHCERHQLPFIKITPRRKYARVSCDMILAERELTREVCLYLERTLPDFSGPIGTRCSYGIGPTLPCHEKVHISRAIELAELFRWFGTNAETTAPVERRLMASA